MELDVKPLCCRHEDHVQYKIDIIRGEDKIAFLLVMKISDQELGVNLFLIFVSLFEIPRL